MERLQIRYISTFTTTVVYFKTSNQLCTCFTADIFLSTGKPYAFGLWKYIIIIMYSSLYLVFLECEKHINEPGLRLIHPSSRLLQAISSASVTVCDKVMGFVLPLLIQQFEKQTQVSIINVLFVGLEL